jgi:serine/threonine protein phosphatase PrpC
VVADGMGGANAGEVASSIAINTVKKALNSGAPFPDSAHEMEYFLHSIILDAHNSILKSSQRGVKMKGMGTTIVIGYFLRKVLYVAWSGDSRCYVYNRATCAEIYPFTDDHSLVWDRVINHEITQEQARISYDSNLILQSLGGSGQKPKPGFRWVELDDGDRILFCSDGLNSMLSAIGIQQILDLNRSPTATVNSLIKAANNAGGQDNITVIVADVTKLDNKLNTKKDTNQVIVLNKDTKITKRKVYYTVLVMILLLISASGFMYHAELSKFIRSYVLVKQASINGKDLSMINDSSYNEILDKTLIVHESEPIIINKEFTNGPILPISDSVTYQTIDSALVESDLIWLVERMIKLKNKIEWSEPGGAIGYTPIFYEQVKHNLDSVLLVVDRLGQEIGNVASFSSSGNLMKVHNYLEAKRIFPEWRNTILFLEMRIEYVGETYRDNKLNQ